MRPRDVKKRFSLDTRCNLRVLQWFNRSRILMENWIPKGIPNLTKLDSERVFEIWERFRKRLKLKEFGSQQKSINNLKNLGI